jgi:hypothetical protein
VSHALCRQALGMPFPRPANNCHARRAANRKKWGRDVFLLSDKYPND